MYVTNRIILLVTLITELCGYCAGFEVPKILSDFETTLQVNQNYTIVCQGNRRLKWIYPEDHVHFWTTFDNELYEITNSTYAFESKLSIYNMSYPFVGFYTCEHEDDDIFSDNDSARIYLFVNDTENFSILENEDDVKIVTVTPGQEAILPCKPTSSDVDVTLICNGEIITMNEESSTGTYIFDPLYGFTTNCTTEIGPTFCICRFTKNNEAQMRYVQVIVEFPVDELSKPDLKDKNEGHTVIGNPLILECSTKTSINKINFHWKTPKGPIEYSRMNITRTKKHDLEQEILTIHDSTLKDLGYYTCSITDYQKHRSMTRLYVNIFDTHDCFLNLTEPNNAYYLITTAGERWVQWNINVLGHPVPNITWSNNKNKIILSGFKYTTTVTSQEALLKIKNIDIDDFGFYTIKAKNNCSEKSLNLFLNVTDKPRIHLETQPYNLINELSTVRCVAKANPEPKFRWKFKACLTNDCQFETVDGRLLKRNKIEFISELVMNASSSGLIKCFASNYNGTAQAVTTFFVTDVKHGFDISGIASSINVNENKSNATVAVGDQIVVSCAASKDNFTDIQWIYKGKIISNNERYTILKSATDYSNKIELQIQNVNFSDTGVYSCRVTGPDKQHNDGYLYKNISFIISNPIAPNITNSSMVKNLEILLPEAIVMTCKASGLPKPTIIWYKDGEEFRPQDTQRIQIHENKNVIIFTKSDVEDEGTYKCEARNKIGVAHRQQMIKFINKPYSSKTLIVAISVLSIILVVAIILILIKIRKERKIRRELQKLGLENFENGAVENINPELGIDEQAEFLPYDRNWEFPIEQLKLGKQLGSGAFGVVLKGEAKNIVEGEPVTTVAVKMVKRNADQMYIRSLVSELKIMIHLGKHLNVVNLLGACTKNVVKKELLVIVEYCRFGNLQNFLLRHRDVYINQVNVLTDEIDYAIGQEVLDRTFSVSSESYSNIPSPSFNYASYICRKASNFSNNIGGSYSGNSYVEKSPSTDETLITPGKDALLNNSSTQPEWRSNYKGDYKGNIQHLCTKDLLAWSFQVARGMDYLASRNVLHGDLAARNILLSENNIVKICDFGLAKSVYKNENYKKKSDGPLPIKWMAIESIRDRIFSIQTDVWSFGIVLWEFFSLARTPYPGMEADERLYQKLLDGYRMESPEYASKDIYKIMTDCWASLPSARPSFTQLSERIGNLLEESLREHYVDLNNPYLVMNAKRIAAGHNDYLSMTSPSNLQLSPVPHYVNEMVGQDGIDKSGYLTMNSKVIFSPRVEAKPFDFNVKNRNSSTSEGCENETLPMLPKAKESECETPKQISNSLDGFSNPSYSTPPKIKEKITENDIIKTADNYVNMPENKSFIEDKNTAIKGIYQNDNNAIAKYEQTTKM